MTCWMSEPVAIQEWEIAFPALPEPKKSGFGAG